MTHDLSHIYHRPGELFWLECDPFQQAVPCFDWTPETWRAVEWADKHVITCFGGFKLH